MKYFITKKSEQVAAKWAGGTTTQLTIYPEGTEYSKFNFTFRLSTATVEVEQSTFTFMPGVTRNLMILKGNLKIDHTDRCQKDLALYDIDVFDGEWPTTAKGKVTDFNLMTRGKASGKLSPCFMLSNKVKRMVISSALNYSSIYVNKGEIEINIENIITKLETGDFILFEHTQTNSEEIVISALAESDLVIAEIKL